jgi:hypothetical protein
MYAKPLPANTERRNTNGEGTEVAIIDVLVDEGLMSGVYFKTATARRD